MLKPKVLVLGGYGINCETETAHAFEMAGADPKIVHINDVIDGLEKLSNYRILALPGGFSFGDDLGSGLAFANKIRNNMQDELYTFIQDMGRLVIGICNGFQTITNLGLAPALNGEYGKVQVALTHNESARFKDRWVDLIAEGNSPWVKGIDKLAMPIRHGEGRFYASPEVLAQIEGNFQVALRYAYGEICLHFDYPKNPNGSLHDIAGITDSTGRIFGLMPHPEAFVDATHDPRFTYLREQCSRMGLPLNPKGDGLKIFENGVNYCNKS